MTDEQINAAIAEACGRRRNPKGGWYPNNGWEFGTQGILNYCTDLNAMHEAELWLRGTDDERLNSVDANKRWALYTHNLGYWCGIVATARQRAEAFLRTLGKWEPTTEESSAVQKEVQG